MREKVKDEGADAPSTNPRGGGVLPEEPADAPSTTPRGGGFLPEESSMGNTDGDVDNIQEAKSSANDEEWEHEHIDDDSGDCEKNLEMLNPEDARKYRSVAAASRGP